MASSTDNVLVFGPTGAVGSAAALEAHRRGAHVWLAMRDTNKPIQGLNESEGRYTRIEADLSKPDTLAQAVKQSSAKTAFVYTIFESQDNMSSSFAALRSAGITHITILSSFFVQGPADNEANMKDFISSVHAKTEVALKASGVSYTTVRPMYFNSNVFWYTSQIKSGSVDLLYPDIKFDYLSPSDIGAVSGAVLANPAFQEKEIIYLCGPELMTQEKAFGIMAKTLGREIKVNAVSPEKWKSHLGFVPERVLDTLAESLKESHEGKEFYTNAAYEEGRTNLGRYKEAEPMGFGEWVERHRDVFL